MSYDEFSGFDEFSDLLKEFDDVDRRVNEILQIGADELCKDIKSLPQPRSKVAKAGYTHLLDTIASRKEGKEVVVGWGKYYGPMLEKGTKKMEGQGHLANTFKRNADKYYDKMTKEIYRR